MHRLNRQATASRFLLVAFLATLGLSTSAFGQTTPTVKITDPTINSTLNIGPLNSTYTISVTIQRPYYPTGGKLTYTDASGGAASLKIFQNTDFIADPNDSTKYTAKFSCGSGTYNNVTLRVNAHRDADSGGNPAADASDIVTGLTVIKQ